MTQAAWWELHTIRAKRCISPARKDGFQESLGLDVAPQGPPALVFESATAPRVIEAGAEEVAGGHQETPTRLNR